MRALIPALAVTLLLLPGAITPADAQRTPRPWCLQSSHDGPGGGLPDCTYHTLEQCRASLGGGTDGCFRNPALGWDQLDGRRPTPRGKASRDN